MTRPDTPAQEHADTVPRSWIVMWKDVSTTEQLAWFQASRRNGSAPRQGEEVVAAEDYDALLADVERLTAERDEAREDAERWHRDALDWQQAKSEADDAAEAAEALAERRGDALRQIKPLVTGDLPPLTPLPMTMRCVGIADIIDAALDDGGQQEERHE